MLVVQRITTRWTKSSRGGDAAARHNATPLGMQLPPLPGATPGYLFHDVRFQEWDDFACHASVVESAARNDVRIEPLFLHVTRTRVTARFVWSRRHCGAPERDSHDLFRLELGQWGRFVCNGRFGADSFAGCAWTYHRTVFNVALIEDLDRDMFIDSTPDAQAARLAVLR